MNKTSKQKHYWQHILEIYVQCDYHWNNCFVLVVLIILNTRALNETRDLNIFWRLVILSICEKVLRIPLFYTICRWRLTQGQTLLYGTSFKVIWTYLSKNMQRTWLLTIHILLLTSTIGQYAKDKADSPQNRSSLHVHSMHTSAKWPI